MGIQNTLDAVLVGETGYLASNVSFDANTIKAETGYSVQIAASGTTAQGLGFGRYNGIQEYVSVIDGNVYTATPTATAWTKIASGASSGDFLFHQIGPKLYAVNSTDGLIEHTIGLTDWSGQNKPVTPTSDITFTEKIFNTGYSDVDGSLKRYLVTATWQASGEFGLPAPSYQSSGDYDNTFTFGKGYQYSQQHTSYKFQLRAKLASSIDLSNQDYYVMGFRFDSNTGNKSVLTNSLGLTLKSSGGIISTPYVGNQKTIQPEDHKRDFYFTTSRSDRAAINEIIFDFGVKVTGSQGGSFLATDTFELELYVGDSWQNNLRGFLVSDGPVIGTRNYGYSVKRTSTGTESDLSPLTKSPETPALGIYSQFFPSSYTRCYLTNVTSGGLTNTDTLQLYRQSTVDKSWRLIGTTTNASGVYVDDHYMEWELDGLTRGGLNSNLPTGTKPQAIGGFRASLVLGIGPDMFISRPGQPNQFEELNAAPDPEDQGQGRSVFVDDSQSENVNTVHGSNILYAGTNSRLFASYGDLPFNMTAPKPIDNNGPIGPRAATLYRDGLAFVNYDALWFLKYSDLVSQQVGNVEASEISIGVGTSFDNLAVDSGTVVVESDGDLLVFSDSRYLKLDRRYNRFSYGNLYHNIVAAVPDYTLNCRLLTDNGALLKWKDTSSTTFAGSSINWTYQTGKLNSGNRIRLLGADYVTVGNPTLRISTWDGQGGSGYIDYTLSDTRVTINNFDAGQHEGSTFQFLFSGTESDQVTKFTLEVEGIGGGQDN